MRSWNFIILSWNILLLLDMVIAIWFYFFDTSRTNPSNLQILILLFRNEAALLLLWRQAM